MRRPFTSASFVVENDYDIRFIEYNELNRNLSLAIVIG